VSYDPSGEKAYRGQQRSRQKDEERIGVAR
jgi:hypothetical protein